jgi:hypothetical protein
VPPGPGLIASNFISLSIRPGSLRRANNSGVFNYDINANFADRGRKFIAFRPPAL